MSLRSTIVSLDPSTVNVTEFCVSHGVSTWFFWDLRRRFDAEGDVALEPGSRAPKKVANKTTTEMEDLLVHKRKELLDAGLDAGPASIRAYLERDGVEGLPSEATIWRRLKARGFIADEPNKAPKRATRSFTASRANECWQIDDTTWTLATGTDTKILNVIDDHSRLLVASVAMPTCTGARTFDTLAHAAQVIGWPERILTDNAKAFRHTVASAVASLGVAARHSRPYHPQTNGKVERFHLTLKKWLAEQPPAATNAELQAQLDKFTAIYNHHRPHRSLARRTPAETWTTAPKSGPANHPLAPPNATTRTYTTKVIRGIVTAGQDLQITIGAAYNGKQATTIVTGHQAHVFVDGELARQLTIDPTHRHQPLHTRPGRPTVREDPRHP